MTAPTASTASGGVSTSAPVSAEGSGNGVNVGAAMRGVIRGVKNHLDLVKRINGCEEYLASLADASVVEGASSTSGATRKSNPVAVAASAAAARTSTAIAANTAAGTTTSTTTAERLPPPARVSVARTMASSVTAQGAVSSDRFRNASSGTTTAATGGTSSGNRSATVKLGDASKLLSRADLSAILAGGGAAAGGSIGTGISAGNRNETGTTRTASGVAPGATPAVETRPLQRVKVGNAAKLLSTAAGRAALRQSIQVQAAAALAAATTATEKRSQDKGKDSSDDDDAAADLEEEEEEKQPEAKETAPSGKETVPLGNVRNLVSSSEGRAALRLAMEQMNVGGTSVGAVTAAATSNTAETQEVPPTRRRRRRGGVPQSSSSSSAAAATATTKTAIIRHSRCHLRSTNGTGNSRNAPITRPNQSSVFIQSHFVHW